LLGSAFFPYLEKTPEEMKSNWFCQGPLRSKWTIDNQAFFDEKNTIIFNIIAAELLVLSGNSKTEIT